MMNDLALFPFLTACGRGEPPFRMTARFQAEPPVRIPASPQRCECRHAQTSVAVQDRMHHLPCPMNFPTTSS